MASEASLVPEPQIKQITKQVLGKYNSIAAIATGPTIYLVAIITGLSGKQALQVIMYAVPVLVVLFAMIGPNVFLGRLVRRAFSVLPGDAPGERIGRLLRMPRQIEIFQTVWGGIGIGIYASICAAVSGQSWLTVPWAVAAVGLVSLLQGISVRLSIEKLLRPFAIAEFQKAPDVVLPGGGFTWPRQWWYLPYTFAVFVADTLMMAATIIGRQASNYYDLLMAELPKTAHNEVVTRVQETLFALARDTAIPLAVLGAYLLALAAFSAWLIAQHQSAGAKEVENAMAALAAGKPRLPNWIATDEVGDLAAASTRAFERLKKFSLSLGQSAHALRSSAEDLSLSAGKQTEVLTLQATALQETQVTTQEIKQTSALASQKAESILRQAEQAEEISRAGETAIQSSLSGLQEIGEQVREMAKQIKSLDDRTRQIANITTTVKDLADQSNMLALNAAIEAVRSGEHGKGFGVVAREIRGLADQSIQATNNVREILQDISSAIRSAVSITEKGSDKVESSLIQVREFGDNIRQLSGIVRDNAASVRQITAAVTQQNTGITQIFQAISDLSRMMDQTMSQMRASDSAASLVRNVADEVTKFVGDYAWSDSGSMESKPSEARKTN